MEPSKFPKSPKTWVTQGTVCCVLLCRAEIPCRTLIIIILYPEAWDWTVCILTGTNRNVTAVTQLLRSFKKFSTVFGLATSCIGECVAWRKKMDQAPCLYLCKELTSQWWYIHPHLPKNLLRCCISICYLQTSLLLKYYNLSFLFQGKREKLTMEPISRQIFIPKCEPTSKKNQVQLHWLQFQLLPPFTRVLIKSCSTWHVLTKLSLIGLAFLKNVST